MARPSKYAVKANPAPATMPAPLLSNWSWQEKGACREEDPELFYYSDDLRGKEKEERIQKAKAICNRCEVKAQCLEYAISVPEKYGIWGGCSEEELANLARSKKRAERRLRLLEHSQY